MEKIKLPAKKLPERTSEEKAEYREKRELRVIEQNHQMAVAAVEIEKLISAHEPADLNDPQLRAALENLPFAWQGGFREMIERYFRKRKSAKEGEDRIMLKSGAEQVAAEKISEVAGQWLFKEITKEDSEDLVTFQKKEGYFILHYANEKDYFLACYGRDKKTGMVKKTSEAGSHSDWLVVEGGSGYDVSTVMIKGKERGQNSVVVHERQHFINHKVMRMFSDQEPTRQIDLLSPPWEERNSLRNIKDEVLAYIRDGSDGKNLITALSDPLYAHLFKGLKSDTEAKTKAVIQTVGDFLDHQAGMPKEDERAMLVYQLFHVSFLEFPKWLGLIEKYYLRRRELGMLFYDYDNYVMNVFDYGTLFLKEDTFPSSYTDIARDIFSKAQEVFRLVKDLHQAGVAVVYNLQLTGKEAEERVKIIVDQYQKATAQLKELIVPLCPKGAFVPHAGPTWLYKYEGKPYKQEEGSTSSTKKIKQAVLDEVSIFSLEKINAIVNFLDKQDLKKPFPEARYELQELISGVVKRFNNNQSVLVLLDKDLFTKGSFSARVQFTATPEDKFVGIDGVKFDIVFYGSPRKK